MAVNLQVRIKNNSKTQQEDHKAAIAANIAQRKTKPHTNPRRQILTKQTTTDIKEAKQVHECGMKKSYTQ